jgi:hypothetical protein
MILDSTTKIEIVLASAITTNQPAAHVFYRDWNEEGSPTKPALTRVAANSTTDVTALAAPIVGRIREVLSMSVYNRDTVSATVTVKTDDSTTERIVVKITLLPDDTLQYTQDEGWRVIDTNGNVRTSSNASINVTIDRFSGDASDTTFVLTTAPGSKNNTWVFIDGVYQQKTEYELSGSTITFDTAPPTGTDNIEVAYATTLTIGTPSDGTVTGAKLATAGITSAQLASALSDETGTGSVVFSASPTFTGTLTAAAITGTGLLDLSGASAGQIKFPATQNASTNANTLDDYEEGTWTPADASGAGLTFSHAVGWYTKVGNLVTAAFSLAYPATANGSNNTISGMPFTALASTNNENRQGHRTGLAMTAAGPGGFIIGSGTATFIAYSPETFGSFTNAQLTTATCIGTLIYKV